MRVRDIEAGKEYATCDGRLVVPESPVVKEWVRRYDSEKKTHVFDRVATTDPWGGCGNARRPEKLGVLFRMYDVDRDGVREDGYSALVVIDPRDVKGTWQEYLVLHGKKVREVADKRTWEQRLSTMRRSLGVAAAEALPGMGPLHTNITQAWQKTNEISNVSVDINIETVEQWDAFVAFMASQGVSVGDAAQVREYLPTKEAQ